MPRRSHRPIYIGVRTPRLTTRQKMTIRFIFVMVLIAALLIPSSLYLKRLSGEIALSDATDLITLAINDTINRKMAEGAFDYNYFVNLEKDGAGNITAITTNMSRINTLSSELLKDVVATSNGGVLDIGIPLGNLLGSNILAGKGPDIPVRIIMLTSSFADFRNELVSSGINQTKHQILLEVVVDIDILVPWETLSTKVVSEVLVAETVIVGKVPDTYLNLE
jgi:sporulation protein YunB